MPACTTAEDASASAQAVVQPAPWSTPGQWTVSTDVGSTVSGYLPRWAENDPSQKGVPLHQLSALLTGISLRSLFEGQMMPLVSPELTAEAEEDAVFEGSIDCNPHDPDPALRQPHVTLQVTAGHWIRGLDPDGLTRITAQLREQADRLDQEILPQLIAARQDWAGHQIGQASAHTPA